MSDGTEYFKRPPSGGIIADKGKTQRWEDDEGNVWEPVRIEGQGVKGMWWRMKSGK